MPLLSRKKPFHHTSGSSTNLHHENVNISNNNNFGNTDSNTPPPLLKRSSKSFLSFMSRKPSMESIRSDKSNDSNFMNNEKPDHHTQQQQQHHYHHNTGLDHSNYTSHPNHHHSNNNNNNNNNNNSNNNSDHMSHRTNGGHTITIPNHSDHSYSHATTNSTSNTMSPKPSHSMAELKRFFRSSKKSVVNLHNLTSSSTTSSNKDVNNSTASNTLQNLKNTTNHHPYSTTTLNLHAHYQHEGMTPMDHKSHTNSAIPPSSDSVLSLSNTMNIYHDDTILAQKYGKLGKTLGSGAGGSVKVLIRPTDGATFAVKEFRPRKSNESIKQYAKKCTAEFCIGSSLHHPNVVQTIDIFSDFHQNKYFQVMEYLPVDFFAVVMTGLMSRGEINCCFKQAFQGVRYLHSMGLAHRDLKLDNCVMNSNGILKLIDFGSAVVFRYPFENEISMAHGIVGSDPYLAPEVITSTKSYDPQFVDIWSMGIIFCCMMLKRFPWKAPKMSDDNFKLYSMEDDFPHDYNESAKHHEHLLKERKEKREQHHDHRQQQEKEQSGSNNQNATNTSNAIKQLPTPPKDEKITPNQNSEQNNNNEQTNDNDNEKLNQENNTTADSAAATTANAPTSNVVNDHNSIPKPTHQTNHHTNRPVIDSQDNKSIMSSKTTRTTQGSKPHHQKKVIHGPYRLLRLLPHASRPILSKILEVDPTKRATLIDIFNDTWFDEIPYCTIDMKNNTIRAPGHHHTIVKDDKTYKI